MIYDMLEKSDILWNSKGEVDYVDEWFLMSSPVSIILILFGYWLFVLKVGPEYMKKRPAFNINIFLTVYNIGQVGLSCYLCYIGTKLVWPNGLVLKTCIMEDKRNRYLITSSTYVYFIAKMTELLDTVFFILRKNNRQVTFLHVYHHSIMLLSSWLVLKYEPSYDTIFVGTLNSLVHVVMYTYYYLSTFPELSKYLWWKKYITKMQITQFVLVIIQTTANFWFSGCPPTYMLLAAQLCNACIFLGLFIKFYVRSYNKTNKID